MKKPVILALLCTSLVFAFNGCSGNKEKSTSSPTNRTAMSSTIQNATTAPVKTQTTANTGTQENKLLDWKISLYFPDSKSIYLVKEDKSMRLPESAGNPDSIADRVKIAFDELSKDVRTAIPKDTQLLSAEKSGDTLQLDFSKEFVQNFNGGSTAVNMLMSQLVLTMTELEGINQISITVDGKVLEDFKGHIELNRTFSRSEFLQFLEK